MHYHLALLTLLALSISAIIIEPIEPIEPEPIYITLPGWPPCPSQCVIAVPKETPHAAQEPVCFAEPAHDPPCSYYYCCGEPVTCGFYKEVCVNGTFDTSVWVPSPARVLRPEPQRKD